MSRAALRSAQPLRGSGPRRAVKDLQVNVQPKAVKALPARGPLRVARDSPGSAPDRPVKALPASGPEGPQPSGRRKAN